MIDLANIAKCLLRERLSNLRVPNLAHFHPWRKGLYMRVLHRPAKLLRRTGELIDLGKIALYYADQNPAGSSRNALKVRRGVLRPHEAGWLWTQINGTRRWLAFANRTSSDLEADNVNGGWIDDNGTLIIKE